MKYFLDSAKMDEIEFAYENYGIDGVTTNPRHIMASGKPFDYFIESISKWVKEKGIVGADSFPISVEIDPFLEKWEDMFEMGKRIAAYSPNFVIKIPCCEQGIIAARKLEQAGVRTNVTLVFSPSQALMAAKLGAKFVSPFVGWKESSGEDTSEYIEKIIEIYANYDYKTEIIVAALRSGKQIVDAAVAGADIVTCGLSLYKDSFAHPFTDYGLNIFRDAWKNTAKE
ncbi:MAG: transaldolase [Ruminococcaceae bacterium]|nr:transaldolase [Oscillospiraceae bacterium]